MTADLFGFNYEQTESDIGPTSFTFNYAGKDNSLQISQYLSISYFAGAEYKHSFDGKLSGGYRNEKHTITLNAPAVKYQIDKAANKAMTNDFSFSLNGRIAFILGVEGELSFGVRDKEKREPE